MKIISHRGNLEGPNKESENNPDQIIKCINKGLEVEIDLFFIEKSKNFYLGHDKPQYKISLNWLTYFSSKLWIHCKNIDCLHELTSSSLNLNFFWHQNDNYTLTNNKNIWAYPGREFTSNTIVVLPETFIKFNEIKLLASSLGICTDYPMKYMKDLNLKISEEVLSAANKMTAQIN